MESGASVPMAARSDLEVEGAVNSVKKKQDNEMRYLQDLSERTLLILEEIENE